MDSLSKLPALLLLLVALLVGVPAAAQERGGQGGPEDDASLESILADQAEDDGQGEEGAEDEESVEDVGALLDRVQGELTGGPGVKPLEAAEPAAEVEDAGLQLRRVVREPAPAPVPTVAPPPSAAVAAVRVELPAPAEAPVEPAAPAPVPAPRERLDPAPFRFSWPLEHVRVTSGYGMRRDPKKRKRRKMHRGVDLGGAIGTPVKATGPARVLHAGQGSRASGICVILEHPNGWVSMYLHLSKVEVKVGEVVKAGELIGRLGNTGRSTGPHLHFQLVKAGKTYDPKTLIGKWSNKVK